MGWLLGWLFGETAADVVVECRRCGTTLSAVSDNCPVCDSNSIARYEIQ